MFNLVSKHMKKGLPKTEDPAMQLSMVLDMMSNFKEIANS